MDANQIKDYAEKMATFEKVRRELGGSNDGNRIKSLEGSSAKEKFNAFVKLADEIGEFQRAEKIEEKIAGILAKGNGNPSFGGKMKAADFSHVEVPVTEQKGYKPKSLKVKEAYAFANFFRSMYLKDGKSRAWFRDWCADNLEMKAISESGASGGDSLVPYEFIPTLIRLIEEYGVIRKNMTVWQTTSNLARIPKLVEESDDAEFADENTAATEAGIRLSNIEVVIKKILKYQAIPYELLADSPIAYGDILARTMGWRFGLKEDIITLLGTGNGQSGRTKGLIPTILAVDPSPTNITALYASAATTFVSVTRTEVVETFARLAGYVKQMGKPKIYCTNEVAESVFHRLAISQQGSYAQELIDGLNKQMFDGYEIVITQALDSYAEFYPSEKTPVFIFGDIDLSTKFVDRQQFEIATSEHVKFIEDQLVFRAKERIGITTHDVGKALNSPDFAHRRPPVVLMTLAA